MGNRNVTYAVIVLFIAFIAINIGIIAASKMACHSKKSPVQISDCSADVLDTNRTATVMISDRENSCTIGMAIDNVAVADCNYADFIRILGTYAATKDVNQFRIRFLDGDLTKEGFERK